MYWQADIERILADETSGHVTSQHKRMLNSRTGRIRHNFYVDGKFAAHETRDGSYKFVNAFAYLNDIDNATKVFKLELTFANEQDLESTLKVLEDAAEEYFEAFEVKRTTTYKETTT